MKKQSFLIILVTLVFSQVSLSISSESTDEDTCDAFEDNDVECDDDDDECIPFEIVEIRSSDINHEKEKWSKPQNSDDLVETLEDSGKKDDGNKENILVTDANKPKSSFAPKKVTPGDEVVKRQSSSEKFKPLPKKMDGNLDNFESKVKISQVKFTSEEQKGDGDEEDDDEDNDDDEDDEKTDLEIDTKPHEFDQQFKRELEMMESELKQQEEIYKAHKELEELEKRRKQFDELKKTLKEIENLVNDLKFMKSETEKNVWKPNLHLEL